MSGQIGNFGYVNMTNIKINGNEDLPDGKSRYTIIDGTSGTEIEDCDKFAEACEVVTGYRTQDEKEIDSMLNSDDEDTKEEGNRILKEWESTRFDYMIRDNVTEYLYDIWTRG